MMGGEVTRIGSCRKTRRMLPRRRARFNLSTGQVMNANQRCVVKEKAKSGIKTVTEVLLSLYQIPYVFPLGICAA